ncbi:hypothetical protein ACVR1I_03080 [Streptococcus cameli]
MIEKMKAETLDKLTDIFFPNLVDMQSTEVKEHSELRRKECLYLLQKAGKEAKDFSEELLAEYHVAYQEIEALIDTEFDALREEILGAEVADLSLVAE